MVPSFRMYVQHCCRDESPGDSNQTTRLTRWECSIQPTHHQKSLTPSLQQCLFLTDLNVARDHNVAFIISPLFLGVTSFVYIDVILEELLSPSITNSKLPAVIRDAPFPEFDQSINQSV